MATPAKNIAFPVFLLVVFAFLLQALSEGVEVQGTTSGLPLTLQIYDKARRLPAAYGPAPVEYNRVGAGT